MVTIFDGSIELGTATASPLGLWIFVVGTLSPGQNTIFAKATSAAGVSGLPSGTLTTIV